MSEKVRVRFAASPGGALHLGDVRTALFNYLFANGNHGTLVLRIDDVGFGQAAAIPVAIHVEDVMESLQWLGLKWDEGPIFQSQRVELYQKMAHELLAANKAYRDPSGAVRFRTPRAGDTMFVDQIHGEVRFQNSELDEFVLLKEDGMPTTVLASLADDLLLGITHVIRGDEHLANTPRQILLAQALGQQTPAFAHLPMIVGEDKKKLGKRHGVIGASEFRRIGVLPQALINYLAHLGWGYEDQEIFSREDLLRLFSLERVRRSNVVFNPEKLFWLNGHYIREARDEEVGKLLHEHFSDELCALGKIGALREKLLSENGLSLIGLCKAKVRGLRELATLLRPLLWEGEIQLDAAVYTQWNKTRLAGPFEHILSELEHVKREGEGLLKDLGVSASTIETLYRATAARFEMKMNELLMPTRFFVEGATAGPPLFELLARMPWGVVERRLRRYAEVLV